MLPSFDKLEENQNNVKSDESVQKKSDKNSEPESGNGTNSKVKGGIEKKSA